MEATIRITVTTIIISRREKPSGRFALLPWCRYTRRPTDALSITTHRQRKLDSGAATAELPRQPAQLFGPRDSPGGADVPSIGTCAVPRDSSPSTTKGRIHASKKPRHVCATRHFSLTPFLPVLPANLTLALARYCGYRRNFKVREVLEQV